MSSVSGASPSVKDSASVASTSDAATAVGSKRKAKSQTSAVKEEAGGVKPESPGA